MLLLCTMIMGIGSAWAETKSVDITPDDALNQGGVDPINIVCAKGDGTSNPAISSGQLRLYQAASGKTTGNTITFSSEKTITSIVFTFANDMTADNGVFSEGEYDSSTSTWTGSTNSVTLTVTGTTSGKRIYISAMTVYYDDSGSQLANSDFALTGAPVALTFDLYNNADAQTISYTSSSTGAVTVSESEYVEAVVNETAKTITVTPKKKSREAQTITVSQAADNTYKAGSATFTVTIADSTPTTGSWVLTDLADLVEGDVFVIVGYNGATYAMSNDNGTGSAPAAVAVTVANDVITSIVGDNIKWNVSGNANDGYTFYPNGSTETWLYCTNSNNGVRVGTNNAKTFVIDSNYLKHSGTSRYVGIYDSQDWRCYTSINANIKDQTFAFYKYMDDATVKAPVITVDETFVGSTTATITCATEGATIYYSFNGENWTEYTDALTITETTTIYAKAVMGEDESAVVQKTTTKTLPTPQINIDDSGITNTDVYAGIAAGSLAAYVFFNNAAIEGATVTWSGNNDEVATINATTGAVTLVAAGNVTFTATFAGNNDYNGATATYEMTVFNNDPNAPGTEDNPYTVAEAIAYINTLGTSTSPTDVYVSGIISQVDSYNGTYKSITYWISDDGTTAGQMEVYSGKGLNNADFSSKDDLQVGDIVTVKGKVKMYNTTPEFDKNNYLVSFERPVSTTPSITVSSAEVNVDADEHDGTLDLTYENLTISSMDDFGIQFYDAEGEILDDPDWIYVLVAEQDPQVGEGYVVSYSIDANDGEERSAYFKVFTYNDEVYSDLITVTQAAYVAPEETIGTFVKVTSTDDITSGQYLIVYEEGSVAFNGSLEGTGLDVANNTIDVEINNGTIAATTTNAQSVFNIDVTARTLQSASGYYIGVTTNSNGLKTSENAEAYTNSFSIDENGDAVIAAVFEGSTMSLRYNKASNQERFRYYKDSGQQAIQLYKFVADEEDVTVTVTSAGYATYCSEKALDFSDAGLTAYKAILDGSEVSFTEVKQVPAGEGVLLKGDAGTYSVPVAASAAALTGNAFIGVIEETLVSEPGIFVLMNEEEGVGFYKTLNAFTVGAHTAYLPALPDGSRSFIGLNETTGISDVNRETITNNRYFDLQGRSVAQPTKGLYIVNGKKVVVK